MLGQLLLGLFDDLRGMGPGAGPSAVADTPPPSPPSPPLATAGTARRHYLAESRSALERRLQALGITEVRELRVHTNSRTMVSWQRGTLRLHAGYAAAPDAVLAAVVRFLDRRTPRALRLQARRILLAHPVADAVPPEARRAPVPAAGRARAADPPRPGDAALVARLRERHALLNARHFDGRLAPVPLRVSGRMRRKLGHVALAAGQVTEIALSRRHLQRDGEAAWMETLLHEMVHQWQAETGRPVDHGAEFRRKAREVGITPRAVRPA